MMRGPLAIIAFISVIIFPWPFTAVLALASAFVEPLVPLAVGLFADTLYYIPHAGYPYFTLWGAVVTTIALVVQSRLRR